MARRDGVVSQWIVEDRFCNGRPPLEEVGAELEHAGRSTHTLRAYRSELTRLAAFYDGRVADLDVQMLRAFLATRATRATLSAASRARTHAALAGFLGCCYRDEHIDADPIARIQRVRVAPPAPRGRATGQ